MKKFIVILVLVPLVSFYGFAKKSGMNPQLQEKVLQDLNQSLYGIIIKGGIYADYKSPVWLVVKNAGESEISWDKCLGSLGGLLKNTLDTLDKGVPVIIEEVTPKKWGFRISFRTMEKIEYKGEEVFWEKITKDGKEQKFKSTRPVKKRDFYLFRIDLKFNEKYYENTPENIKFIHDTLAREFIFFKSKEDVLVYMDNEAGASNEVEIGMSVEEVIARLGFPVKKIKFKNKMLYKYPDWLLKFEDDKVIDVIY